MMQKALTVNQPMAFAIISGDKPIENRSWQTDYRGPLVIHASASKSRLNEWWRDINFGTSEQPLLGKDVLHFGAAIGTVNLVDCVRLEDLPWHLRRAPIDLFNPCGPWCWVLEDPRPFAKPFVCKGSQKFWSVEIPSEYLVVK